MGSPARARLRPAPLLRAAVLVALASRAAALAPATMAPREAAPARRETAARSRRFHLMRSIAPVVGASAVRELARADRRDAEGDVVVRRPARRRSPDEPQYEIVRTAADRPECADGPCSHIEYKLITDGYA